jgi:4-amino-4-deoxy-L-arabinose transferase-like glycosyltransferase
VSAADSQWPAWLRRHTGVELLGPPRLFFAWLTIALSLLMIVYVGAWNAAKYPIVLGYDAQPNAAYAHILLDQHHIPTPEQSGESNQPPAYYFIAEVAARTGHEIFGWLEARPFTAQLPEASYRGAVILNVVLVFLTALCVLWLARVVAPDRPWVWAAGAGFFAFLPVVSKVEAMFHPENLNMLCSAAAIASLTHMFVRRRFRLRLMILFGLAVGLGLATRLSMIFVITALIVGSGIAITDPRIRRLFPWKRVAVVAGVVVLLAAPWVAYRAIVQHSGPFNQTSTFVHAALHPGQNLLADKGTSHAAFFDFSPSVFTTPWRSNFKNQAASETYVEIWGDWLGNFAWSPYDPAPSAAAQRVLKDQSYIGALPTALAVVGWLALLWRASRRERALAPLALLPIFAVGGYLYRSYVALSHDGDLLKAAYALNSAPVWALGFGVATAWLATRSRLARYGMVALFVVFAVLELRFTMYGIRDGVPIF